MSWHLRTLAAHGFITPDDEHGDRRERWWRATDEYTSIPEADYLGEPELRQARQVLAVETLARQFDRRTPTSDMTGTTNGGRLSAISHWVLLLTSEELLELGKEVTAVIERYEDLARGREPREDENQEKTRSK